MGVEFRIEGNIGILILSREKALNSLNEELIEELYEKLLYAKRERNIEAIVLTGKGKGFCAGGDVKRFKEEIEKDLENLTFSSIFMDRLTDYLNSVIILMRRFPKPIVGAINGVVAGAGIGIALCCDILIASKKARFFAGYMNIGAAPDGVGLYFLQRIIGLFRTNEFFYLGKTIEADEALSLGIVSKVVEDEDLLKEATDLAKKMAKLPKRAFYLTKLAVNESLYLPFEKQLENDRRSIVETASTKDFRDRVISFFKKDKGV